MIVESQLPKSELASGVLMRLRNVLNYLKFDILGWVSTLIYSAAIPLNASTEDLGFFARVSVLIQKNLCKIID